MNSASHAPVTCGRRCWTSIKAALPREVTAKTRWRRSCVRLVKLRPSPNAARANVVHPVRPETLAKMAKTGKTAKMEKMAAQAKMPNRKNNSCRYLLSATVTLLLAAPANQDRKDPTDHQAMPEIRAAMDNPDLRDHQDHLDLLAKLENLDRKDPTAMLVL